MLVFNFNNYFIDKVKLIIIIEQNLIIIKFYCKVKLERKDEENFRDINFFIINIWRIKIFDGRLMD